MLGAIHFDNQLCRSTVKVHDKSADDPLFVNLYRVFAEEKVPELTLMGSHFPTKPPGIFQLAVIFWYGHRLPSPSSHCSATSPKGRGKSLSVGFAASSPKGRAKGALNALHRTMYRSAPLYPLDTLKSICIKAFACIFFLQNPMERFFYPPHGNHIFHISSHGHLLNTLYQNQYS